MSMHLRVARNFLSAITFNSPGMANPKPGEQGKPLEQLQEENADLVKELEKKEKEQSGLRKEMEKQQKQVTDVMKKTFKARAEKKAQDPGDLFRQVRPMLSKMGIENICVNNKTSLIAGVTEGENSLYRVLLRREAAIEPDTIDRIKRNSKNLQKMIWSNAGIETYVWYPYTPPAEVAAPAGPGTVPAP